MNSPNGESVLYHMQTTNNGMSAYASKSQPKLTLKGHRTQIFEIQVTRFLTSGLQKIDFSKLLYIKILHGFALRR